MYIYICIYTYIYIYMYMCIHIDMFMDNIWAYDLKVGVFFCPHSGRLACECVECGRDESDTLCTHCL